MIQDFIGLALINLPYLSNLEFTSMTIQKINTELFQLLGQDSPFPFKEIEQRMRERGEYDISHPRVPPNSPFC